MAQKNILLFGDANGTMQADTANTPNAAVVRDIDNSINVGEAKVTKVTNSGPETVTPGASTAAAGTSTTDAGVLPAGMSKVYAVTGADDAKGVRVDVADKVTGRLLLIGNKVSNKILKVYAPAGGTINGAAADAAFSSASGKGVTLYCLDSATNAWLAW